MEIFNRVMYSTELNRIISDEIDKYGVEDYIDRVNFDNYEKQLGVYYPTKKEIVINYGNILDEAFYLFGKKDLTVNQYNRFCNILLLNVIHHELNHALQTKEANKETNDSLHKVIKEGIEFGSRLPSNVSLKESFLYKFMYKKVLVERNAEIMAFTNLLNSDYDLEEIEIEWLKKELKKIIEYGYSCGSTPIKEYYRLRNKMKEYKKLDLKEDHDLLTRLSWGFPEKRENIKNAVSRKLILK